jgi:hypothetical protein
VQRQTDLHVPRLGEGMHVLAEFVLLCKISDCHHCVIFSPFPSNGALVTGENRSTRGKT